MFRDSLTTYFHKDSEQWYTRPRNEPPATTFLRSVVEISEAVSYCEQALMSVGVLQDHTRNSDAIQVFAMSSFAMLMSHFELFQKLQFAELIDTHDDLEGFDDSELAKRLEKEGCIITLQRILAGRGDPREPGQIVADSLGGWHNPIRVNQYFRTVFPKVSVYSNSAVSELELMWQLRHSIVHTGGVITREDAAKIDSLRRFRDRKLIIEGSFIEQVGRRMHVIVKQATELLEGEVRSRLKHSEFDDDPEATVKSIVGCDSPKGMWFEP